MSRAKLFVIFTPVLALAVIVLLVVQPFFGVRTAYAQDQFILTPSSADALGVAPDTAFLLSSREPVSAGDIEKLLVAKTKENVAYDVEQVSDTSVRIAFEEPLTGDEVVKISLPTTTTWPDGTTAARDYNWAFQVKGDFRVVSTIPGDRASGVPLDTGIEFDFNYENVDEAAFERALSFSPALTGHVESSRRAFVFVPDRLEPATLYTATLSKDLGLTGSDETLGEDETFTFETSADASRGFQISLGERYNTVTPDQAVAISYNQWGDTSGEETPVRVKLYRYASFGEYVDALKNAQNLEWRTFVSADDLIATADVQPAMEFDAELTEYDYGEYLLFPSSVPEGYYVADVSRNGTRVWTMIASSNLTAYVSRAVNKTVVWVNDASTNQPVSGAVVQYDGDASSADTDAQGIAAVPSTDEQSNIVTVRTAGSALPIVLHGAQIMEDGGKMSWTAPPVGNGVADAYWTYLYTDRPTYKPTDTVKFWGYAEKRDGGERPEMVHADIGYDSVDVPVTANGTYAGELSLRSANVGSFSLNVSWNGETVATRGLSVTEYVKPAYTLSLTPDVDAAYDGQTVGYSVHGEYFEGTPVNGLEIRVMGECVDQLVTLDDAGNARGEFVCPRSDEHGPRSVWFSAKPARAEEGQIEAGANVMIFGQKIYLDPSWRESNIKDGKGSVDVTVRNTQAVNSWDPERFGPTTRAGVTVNGVIMEITYTQVEIGQTYDFVRKQVVKNYRYDRNEKQVGTFAAVSDANGHATYSFPAGNPDANYRVDLSAFDENGRKDATRVDLWARRDFEYGSSNALMFHNDDAGDADQWSFPGYGLGETVHLSVYQNEKPFAAPQGARFFYYQAQRGIQTTHLSATPLYQFTFTDSAVPNVAVYGVLYADGTYQQVGQQGWWYGSGGYAVMYDSSLAKLNVELAPEQERYAPGQNATVAVHVTDKDGLPVRAAVNLNVVDEAYYSLFPESVNPLGEVYRWVSDGVVSTQVTQDATVSAGLGAEKGGGGERGLGRFTFKDNASFEVVETDAFGNGTLTFKLPDNVTSWRVTAQALNADKKQVGNAQTDVDASLPFFLSPVMRDSYLDADQPTILVHASGTGIGLQDQVEYVVKIPDASFERSMTAAAGDTVRIDLPDLSLGTHAVTISAASGVLQDTVTRQVSIVSSRLVKPVVSTTDGDIVASTAIDGATDRYTDVTFMDAGVGRYYGELQTLSGWWGDRVDEALARLYATELLNETFGESNAVPDEALSAYADGYGVKLLPYASPDFDLTAKVALLGDSPFSSSVSSYFDDALNDREHVLTPRETAQAFAALAATGSPVLAEMQRQAPELGNDPDVRLWVALGFEAAGDSENARVIYRDLVNREAAQKDGYIYLPGNDEETTAERTALLAVLAGALNEPQRDQIHDYVVNQQTGATTLPLERVLYVQKTLPHLIAGDTAFAYTLRGDRKSETVGRGETVTVKAAPEDLARFAIEVSKGSLMVVSRYDSAVVDPSAPVDSSIGLTRTYSAGGTATTSFKEGDVVKVEVRFTVPRGRCAARDEASGGAVKAAVDGPIVPCEQYEVTDVLPSGLTPVTPSVAFNVAWDGMGQCFDSPAKVENQRVSFFASGDIVTACRNDAFTYFARVVTPGTYAAEPAYIRSTRDPETNNHSDAATLVITP